MPRNVAAVSLLHQNVVACVESVHVVSVIQCGMQLSIYVKPALCCVIRLQTTITITPGSGGSLFEMDLDAPYR
jgi:hypothetical protein